jgi:hypothetical protein
MKSAQESIEAYKAIQWTQQKRQNYS